MEAFQSFIENSVPAAWIALIVGFAVLARCADLFVDSSVSLAARFRIPKLLVGMVLVSVATTAPELSVSLLSALRGKAEMALGNAVGSVICNQGLGLALCGLVSAAAVPVIPHVLRTSGGFLLGVAVLCFAMVLFDFSLSRWEGALLLLLFAGYITFMYRQHRGGRYRQEVDLEAAEPVLNIALPRLLLLFGIGLAGILAASHLIITSATTLAHWMRIPEAVIALTLVALGTSIPEVVTCITAARKGHGVLAVGNILGANIMNICWVAGASAVANNLTLSPKEIFFMFPAMLLITLGTLLFLRSGYRLTRRQGMALLGLYVLYLASFFVLFRPQTQG